MNGDPNMETLYEWAANHEGLATLPSNLENEIERLFAVVDVVNWCLGKEFDKDKDAYKKIHGRYPNLEEEPYILVPCQAYDIARKEGFLQCIKRHIREEISEVEEKYHLNLGFRLWSSCLATAKTLSLKTQSGLNTEETRRQLLAKIDSRVATDPIYRIGEEIACIWQPDPKNISFDGVPVNSNARKYESEWSKRQGPRSARQYS